MKRLDMQHRPHETCHTFSTLAKAYNMKDNIRRLIMEHAIVVSYRQLLEKRSLKGVYAGDGSLHMTGKNDMIKTENERSSGYGKHI